jgi:hypothetical protein
MKDKGTDACRCGREAEACRIREHRKVGVAEGDRGMQDKGR